MHVDDGAASMVAELPDADTEGSRAAELGDMALPVHLPDTGREAAFEVTNTVKSEDARGLLAAIRRLESVVEEETIALGTRKKIDFDDFSTRKSRSMLEFVRLMRARMHHGDEVEITEEIRKLRQKLEQNRAILEKHYDAVREVATIIARAIREAESDGTYSVGKAWESK
jgi:hypothetical protein